MIPRRCHSKRHPSYNAAMRLKQLSSLVAVVVVGFGFYAMGADDERDDRPPMPPPAREGREARDAGLHQQMENMGRVFKRLQSQLADSSKNDSSLEFLTQMEQATLACKSQIPAKVMRMPATQQAEQKSDYRQMMVKLFRQELDLEEQLIAGENTKAKQTVAQMDQLQK